MVVASSRPNELTSRVRSMSWFADLAVMRETTNGKGQFLLDCSAVARKSSPRSNFLPSARAGEEGEKQHELKVLAL